MAAANDGPVAVVEGGKHLVGQTGAKHLAPAHQSWARQVLSRARSQIAILFALSGVAIAQPVLDLFGHNPEFFVAGRYSTAQVVGFGLFVTLAPAAVALLVVVTAHFVHPRAGNWAFAIFSGLFAMLFAAVLLRTLDIDGLWLVALGALLVAAFVIWLERTSEVVRRFLSWVALGNAVFLGSFLFASPTGSLILAGGGAGGVGSVHLPALHGPVVFVILDEFPVTTIMDRDGTIDEERFPNFARLAEGSTWFRNASSRIAMTNYAVPSMLSGRAPQQGALPTYADYPRTLFTLFGDRYPIHRYETVTDLCPPAVCTPPPRQSLRTALDDALVVYGYKVLPTSLSTDLPDVGHSWGNFGASSTPRAADGPNTSITDEDPYGAWHEMDPQDRSPAGQVAIAERMLHDISAEPALHYMHLALPHYPWVLAPSGQSATHEFHTTVDADDPAFDEQAVQAYQLHLLQVGAADRLVGDLIDHLQEVGAWDDALVVVTSDHGNSLLPPDLGRRMTDDNREELLRMPLFIKAPGQQAGEIRDDSAQTIDVMPSIVDLLGGRTGWDFDGHSLYDGSEATIEPLVDTDVDPVFDIVARHAADMPYSHDWATLGAVGELGALVGTPVSGHLVGEPSDLGWTLDDQGLLTSLPTQDNQVPFLLLGRVSGGDGDRPPQLLVAINGTFAGVVGAYQDEGDQWRFSGVMSPIFREGSNDVRAYEPERLPDGTVILHVVNSL